MAKFVCLSQIAGKIEKQDLIKHGQEQIHDLPFCLLKLVCPMSVNPDW